MGASELTVFEMHDMISNVMHHSDDPKLIRNILEAIEERSYKDAFYSYETDILSFNNQFNNNKKKHHHEKRISKQTRK